ncbi:hypothetical protein [Methanoregula formicica]|uniref:Uncharacterized protein n=1 Tax=Methanoregula formicica (strain DSM 22288 / NBRC 105244 / SMSP) TaxID=593750 RepID=L0HIW3_METFS|nr:hypothetical protein [Methanoregula formicica]AGB03034.1 hypothetical protein Metfor_2020 [Methanoregula formicica SMSP]
MNGKRFSRKYRTFWEWISVQKYESRYVQRINSLHEQFPELTLDELKARTPPEVYLSALRWDDLTVDEKYFRIRALEALYYLQAGIPFTKAVKKAGISKSCAIRHLGSAIRYNGHIWISTGTDTIQVMTTLFVKGKGIVSALVNSAEARWKIAYYMKAVVLALAHNKPEWIRGYESEKISLEGYPELEFETDIKRLYSLRYSLDCSRLVNVALSVRV